MAHRFLLAIKKGKGDGAVSTSYFRSYMVSNSRVLEKMHQIRLSSFLQGHDSSTLPPQTRIAILVEIGRHIQRDFAYLRMKSESNVANTAKNTRKRPKTRTTREKGSLRRSKSVLFWYFLISLNATVPGLNLFFFRGSSAAVAADTLPSHHYPKDTSNRPRPAEYDPKIKAACINFFCFSREEH